MSDLDVLKTASSAAEARYMEAVRDNPLPRTPDEQAYVDAYLDLAQAASRAYRNANREAFWEKHERGARETREMFPHILGERT